jgi:thymidine phosphorylase
MLLLNGLAADLSEARARIEEAIASGRAAEHFARMVHKLGGPVDLIDRPERHLDAAPLRVDVYARHVGFVAAIETRAIGLSVVKLGGGRTSQHDRIDHAVGLTQLACIGARVDAYQPIATVHARDEDALQTVLQDIQDSYRIGDEPVAARPVVIERIVA